MANGEKVYSIRINGISQSIKDVDKLAESLEKLDDAAAGSGSGSSKGMASDLKESAKATDELAKKYEKLNSIISGEKDEMMEVNRLIKDATKAREVGLAAQRLEADEYGNTLVGLRQKLSDIKKAMTELDVDSNEFATMQKAAGELNSKILELEKGMGDFRRQVGNYASAADGFKSVTVAVGGVNREFSSVRDATKQLEAEIKALSIAGKEDTQEFKDLTKAYEDFNKSVQRANSAVSDLKASSSGMDALLDIGQSIGAIGQITGGFSAFFGSDSEIQRSIQSLMGLMSAMQGLEKLKQQMVTGEGLGAFFTKSSEGIDAFTNKLFGVKPAIEEVKTSEEALKTTTEAATTANNAMAVSEGAVADGAKVAAVGTKGLTVAQKGATVASKALGVALKAIGIGLLIEGLVMAKELLEPFTKNIENLVKALLGVEKIFPSMAKSEDKYNSVVDEGNKLLDKRLDYINILKSQGQITDSQAAEMEFAERIKDAEEAMDSLKKAVKDSDFGEEFNDEYTYPVEEAMERLRNSFDENGKDIRSWKDTVSDAWRQTLGQQSQSVEDAQAILANYTKRYNKAIKLIQTDSKAGRDAINQLINEASSDRLLSSLLANPEKWIDDEGAIAAIKRIQNSIDGLARSANSIPDPAATYERIANRYKEAGDKYQDDIDELNRINEELGKHVTPKNVEQIKANEELIKTIEEARRKALKSANAGNKKIVDLDEELYRLRVMAMKEGLQKTLAQLDIQRMAELKKWQGNHDAIASINKRFDQEEYDRKREWYQRMNDMALQEAAESIRIEKERLDRMEDEQANTLANMKKNLAEYSSYQGGWGNDEKEARTSANYGFADDDEGDLQSTYKYRMEAFENYYNERIAKQREFNKRIYEEDKALIENETKQLYDEELTSYERHMDELEKAYEDAKENDLQLADKIQLAIDQANVNHNNRVEEITKQSELKLEQIKTKYREDDLNAEKEYLDDLLGEHRDFYKHISDMESQSPIYNKAGFINLKKTKENDEKVLLQYNTLLSNIDAAFSTVQQKHADGLIDQETYDNTVKELNSLQSAVNSGMDKVNDDMKGRFGKFWEQVNQWVQYAAQNAQQMLSMLWEMNDANHEAMMEELQNQIDAYQDKYDELEEIQQKHADNVTSIEEKLATARGDRRERLIDQLNSEMEARRKALAEEKKIEQEKNKLQKQKDDEELAQKKKQKERDRISAIINTAMAVSNALAVSPWWAAIVQASIAAAMGAAQISVINSTKYADGGVLVGRSHAQGGIPVLGGKAEVEGGEFVTNKQTTAKNVELLEFVNSRKKRLDLSDFVEFYGEPIRKNIKNAGMKFANGGVLPTLRTDIDVTDRLAASFEAYAQRPVVVSVQEITDRQADVKNVQVLAGL